MNILKRFLSFLSSCLLFGIVLLQLAGCGATNSSQSSLAASSYKPLTLQNCNNSLTFAKAPTRVIATGQNVTDILLKLGLGSSIVGVYYGQRYQPESEFNGQYKHLHSLGGGMMMSPPSKESVLSLKPDFVFSAYPAGDFVASKGMPTRSDFKNVGAEVYGLTEECSLNSTQEQIDDIYKDILNIGKIFGVEDRAQKIVQDMQTRIATVQQKVSNKPLVPSAIMLLFLGSGPTGTYRVVGAGLSNTVMKLAGGKNVFGYQKNTYVSVSKEAFAVQKLEMYVLVHYTDVEANLFASNLYTTFPEVPASKNKRSVVIEGNYWNESVNLPDTIEKLAKAFHPESF